MDQDETRRRLRAARALAGITVEQLAERLPAGLGAKTLYNVERGDRDVRPMELREIAAACGLPYEFFTVEFDRLPELNSAHPDRRTLDNLQRERASWMEQQQSMREQVATLADQVTELRAGLASLAAGDLQRTRELLARPEMDRPTRRTEGDDRG